MAKFKFNDGRTVDVSDSELRDLILAGAGQETSGCQAPVTNLTDRILSSGYSRLSPTDKKAVDAAYASSEYRTRGKTLDQAHAEMDALAGITRSTDPREILAAGRDMGGELLGLPGAVRERGEQVLAGLPAYQAADVRGEDYLQRNVAPSVVEAILPRVAEEARRGAGYSLKGNIGDLLSLAPRAAVATSTIPFRTFLNTDASEYSGVNDLPGMIPKAWAGLQKSVSDVPAVMMATDNPVTDPVNVLGVVTGGVGSLLGKVGKLGKLAELAENYPKTAATLAGGLRGAVTGGAGSLIEGREHPFQEALFGGAADAVATAAGRILDEKAAKNVTSAIESHPMYATMAHRERNSMNVPEPFTADDLRAWLLSPEMRKTQGRAQDLDLLAEARRERAGAPYERATLAARADIGSGKYDPALYFHPLTEEGFGDRQSDIAALVAGKQASQQFQPSITQRAMENAYAADAGVHRRYPADVEGTLEKLAAKEIVPRFSAYSPATLHDIMQSTEVPQGYLSLAAKSTGMPLDKRMLGVKTPDISTKDPMGWLEEHDWRSMQMDPAVKMHPEDYPILAQKLRRSNRAVAPSKLPMEQIYDEAVLDAMIQDLERSPGFRANLTEAEKLEYAKAKSLQKQLAHTRDVGISTRKAAPSFLHPTRKIYAKEGSTYEQALERIKDARSVQNLVGTLREVAPGLRGFVPKSTEEALRGGLGSYLSRIQPDTTKRKK